MKNFKDYSSKQPPTPENISQNTQPQEELSAEELTKRLARAYNGKSSGNILMQILKEAEKSKRAGTLTNQEIDDFYRQFSPMVSPVQRKMLKRVIDKLKEI